MSSQIGVGVKKRATSLYRHYKGKYYKFRGLAHHSESLEALALYDCLYPNDIGKTWVRPKAMFFGNLSGAQSDQPRFAPVEIQWATSSHVSPESHGQIVELLRGVFGEYTSEMLSQKIEGRRNLLLHTASVDGELLGFKLGYEQGPQVFYSSLGAVNENFQGLGIGRGLMGNQHGTLRDKGFEKVVTKTMNRWKAMIILNLACGFQITGVDSGSARGLKIVMEKCLKDDSESTKPLSK